MKKKSFIILLTSMILVPLWTAKVSAGTEEQVTKFSTSETSSTSAIKPIDGDNSSEIIDSASQANKAESSSAMNKTTTSESTISSSSTDKLEEKSTNNEDNENLKEKKTKDGSMPTTIDELKQYWEIPDYAVDNTNKFITLTEYKATSPDDVQIPGSVRKDASSSELYRIWVKFTSAANTSTEKNPDGSEPEASNDARDPSKSIWRNKFNGDGKCSITSVTVKATNGMTAHTEGTMAFAFAQGSILNEGASVQSFPFLSRLDLKGLEVYNSVSTKCMVQNAPNLKYIDVSTWDVRGVADMYGTFYAIGNADNRPVVIEGLESWNPIRVRDLSFFFSTDYFVTEQSLRSIEKWFATDPTPNPAITKMNYMFWNTSMLTQLDLSNKGWKNASKGIKELEGTFGENVGLKTINLNGWRLENILNLNSTFVGTKGLTNLSGLDESTMASLNTMKDTFNNSALEVIDLTSFHPSGSVVTSNTFFSAVPKKLLIINGQQKDKDPTPILTDYNFQNDRREKFEFPYLDANSGKFKDETKQKNYIDSIVQKKLKIFSPANSDELASFKNNNIPLRAGFSFKGWKSTSLNPSLTNDQIEACVASGDVIDYNRNSIYFKAIWEPVNPTTGPDNEVPVIMKDDLDIAYFPKSFVFSETKLSDNNSSQVIPIKTEDSKLTPQYNIGVRDYSEESKGWELTARLQWGDKIIPGSSIMTSNDKGEVKINKNSQSSFNPDLIIPQPVSEKNPVRGVPNLEITTTESKVMEASPSIQNKTFDYDLGTVQLKISDPSIVAPGIYSGNVNWNLSVVPKI
ncbi:BspA family leucine-rich repeat surface protein [Enterococcus hirae]|uniref:BspA family leucine-rich repeat surface protein n=1 Tax=Enterococcus hirae TaxID=1354 RepID=UPI00345AEACD